MNTTQKKKVSLTPIDQNKLLSGLRLTTGKTAEFCDILRRQLCYWTDKGIVETVEDSDNDGILFIEDASRRVYDYQTIKRVIIYKVVPFARLRSSLCYERSRYKNSAYEPKK